MMHGRAGLSSLSLLEQMLRAHPQISGIPEALGDWHSIEPRCPLQRSFPRREGGRLRWEPVHRGWVLRGLLWSESLDRASRELPWENVGKALFELKRKPDSSGIHLLSRREAEDCLRRRRDLRCGGLASHSCKLTFLGNERTYLFRLQTHHSAPASRLGPTWPVFRF